MKHLTFKNIVLAFVALNIFSIVASPNLPSGVNTTNTPTSPSSGQPSRADIAAKSKATSQHLGEQGPPPAQPALPPVIKILDLPDSEALRLNDTTFVDLGWRQTADQGGEWVGHIGSDTEYLPLNGDQIAGMLKEARLKALPLPPVARADTPRSPPKDAPAPLEDLDLVDSEALRLNDTAIVDLGSPQTAEQDSERVSHIGTDAEYRQLSGDHIADLLKEAHSEALPVPPVPPAITPRDKPAIAPPAPEGIDLLDYIPILLGIFFMMYVRYRITQVTVDAAQSATGMVQRALSDLLSSKANAPAKPATNQVEAVRSDPPAAVRAAVKKSSNTKRGTVVRPAHGLFGFLTGAR